MPPRLVRPEPIRIAFGPDDFAIKIVAIPGTPSWLAGSSRDHFVVIANREPAAIVFHSEPAAQNYADSRLAAAEDPVAPEQP